MISLFFKRKVLWDKVDDSSFLPSGNVRLTCRLCSLMKGN